MGKIEFVTKVISETYAKLMPAHGEAEIVFSDFISFRELNEMEKKGQKSKGKKFSLREITQLKNDFTASLVFGIELAEKREKLAEDEKVNITDKSGLFQIEFSDGSYMIFAKWLEGEGRTSQICSAFIADKATWGKFLELRTEHVKGTKKPKNGIYKATFVPQAGGVVYQKMTAKELQDTPVLHPSAKVIESDIEYFFNNLTQFTRFNMNGSRKAMLIGEPGTGKTSECRKLAKYYQATKCVVFCTDIRAVAGHLENCAKYNVSTLVMLEDAESSLERPDSSILNFLDGVDQPINKLGSYIIMTTNHPARIEPRIIQRPGRVDKIVAFGALEAADSVECSKLYFKDIFFTDDEKENAVKESQLLEFFKTLEKSMTGAQIKELSNAALSHVVSNNLPEVDIEAIKQAHERMMTDIKDVYKFAESESLSRSGTLGFRAEKEENFEYNTLRLK
jgi:broad-specificity NMP kinase